MSLNNNVKALKSGVWYTAANFIIKSIGFITTPIFTRLLSHNDYGLYSNYVAWLGTFSVFATLNVGTSFISARFDYEKDFDGYISSTLVLSSLSTLILMLIITLFSNYFSSLTGVHIQYIYIMMVYLMLFSAVDMFQARERYYFEYKISVGISLFISITTILLSILLVVNLDNKLLGRIAGSAIPTVLIGFILYILLIKRGRKICYRYWKYALRICVPYIPHGLSLLLLNSMDKMMITKMCGAEANALYSVAYTCGAVITLLITSLNTAFSPWLGEKLNERRYAEIRKVAKTYILIFVYFTCGIILLTPELLLFMGGESYIEAIYVMPPVALGCVCQFMYTMYVNVEQFSKKTIGMAFASVAAAVSNYILNYIFIPEYGYIAAAYTTLASFLILLFIHMLLVRHIGFKNLYSSKSIFAVLFFMSIYTLLMHILYENDLARYCAAFLYVIVSGSILYKYKDRIILIFSH